MSVRNVTLYVFLTMMLVFVGVLATDWSVWWLAPIHWLERYLIFHILAHFMIFAGVVALYRLQPHDTVPLWVIVVMGGVAVELVQFTVGHRALTAALVLDSTFDLVVDMAGAVTCWLYMTRRTARWGQFA